MTELVALVPSLALTFLLWQERKARDEAEKAWRLERVGLLNRIQAPELAPVYASPEPSDEPLYVPFEDDAAHDRYVEQRDTGSVV